MKWLIGFLVAFVATFVLSALVVLDFLVSMIVLSNKSWQLGVTVFSLVAIVSTVGVVLGSIYIFRKLIKKVNKAKAGIQNVNDLFENIGLSTVDPFSMFLPEQPSKPTRPQHRCVDDNCKHTNNR